MRRFMFLPLCLVRGVFLPALAVGAIVAGLVYAATSSATTAK